MRRKLLPLPLLVILAVAFVSCQFRPPFRQPFRKPAKLGVDQEELMRAYAKPKIRFSRVKVTCRVVSGIRVETLPAIIVRRGHSGASALTSEGTYPTQFDFPVIGEQMGDSFPITPANPNAFETTGFGWTLDLEAGAHESFIMLRGTLTDRRMGSKIRSGGLPFQPITTQASDILRRDVAVTLSDNHAERPSVVSEVFPILIAAQPGGSPYRIYLDDNQETYAEFGCEIIN